MDGKQPRQSKTLKDDVFLAALACGATVEMAAQKAGISKSTAFRRLRDPAVKQRITQIQGETIGRCSAMLTAANLEATKTLLELLGSANSAPVRLASSRTILEYSMRMREHKDIEERLAALERRSETP